MGRSRNLVPTLRKVIPPKSPPKRRRRSISPRPKLDCTGTWWFFPFPEARCVHPSPRESAWRVTFLMACRILPVKPGKREMKFPAGPSQDTYRVARTFAICSHLKLAIGTETVENLADCIKVCRQAAARAGRYPLTFLDAMPSPHILSSLWRRPISTATRRADARVTGCQECGFGPARRPPPVLRLPRGAHEPLHCKSNRW